MTGFRRSVLEQLATGVKSAEALRTKLWPDKPWRGVQGGGAERYTARMAMQLGRMEKATKWVRWRGAQPSTWEMTGEGRKALARA